MKAGEMSYGATEPLGSAGRPLAGKRARLLVGLAVLGLVVLSAVVLMAGGRGNGSGGVMEFDDGSSLWANHAVSKLTADPAAGLPGCGSNPLTTAASCAGCSYALIGSLGYCTACMADKATLVDKDVDSIGFVGKIKPGASWCPSEAAEAAAPAVVAAVAAAVEATVAAVPAAAAAVVPTAAAAPVQAPAPGFWKVSCIDHAACGASKFCATACFTGGCTLVDGVTLVEKTVKPQPGTGFCQDCHGCTFLRDSLTNSCESCGGTNRNSISAEPVIAAGATMPSCIDYKNLQTTVCQNATCKTDIVGFFFSEAQSAMAREFDVPEILPPIETVESSVTEMLCTSNYHRSVDRRGPFHLPPGNWSLLVDQFPACVTDLHDIAVSVCGTAPEIVSCNVDMGNWLVNEMALAGVPMGYNASQDAVSAVYCSNDVAQPAVDMAAAAPAPAPANKWALAAEQVVAAPANKWAMAGAKIKEAVDQQATGVGVFSPRQNAWLQSWLDEKLKKNGATPASAPTAPTAEDAAEKAMTVATEELLFSDEKRITVLTEHLSNVYQTLQNKVTALNQRVSTIAVHTNVSLDGIEVVATAPLRVVTDSTESPPIASSLPVAVATPAAVAPPATSAAPASKWAMAVANVTAFRNATLLAAAASNQTAPANGSMITPTPTTLLVPTPSSAASGSSANCGSYCESTGLPADNCGCGVCGSFGACHASCARTKPTYTISHGSLSVVLTVCPVGGHAAATMVSMVNGTAAVLAGAAPATNATVTANTTYPGGYPVAIATVNATGLVLGNVSKELGNVSKEQSICGSWCGENGQDADVCGCGVCGSFGLCHSSCNMTRAGANGTYTIAHKWKKNGAPATLTTCPGAIEKLQALQAVTVEAVSAPTESTNASKAEVVVSNSAAPDVVELDLYTNSTEEAAAPWAAGNGVDVNMFGVVKGGDSENISLAALSKDGEAQLAVLGRDGKTQISINTESDDGGDDTVGSTVEKHEWRAGPVYKEIGSLMAAPPLVKGHAAAAPASKAPEFVKDANMAEVTKQRSKEDTVASYRAELEDTVQQLSKHEVVTALVDEGDLGEIGIFVPQPRKLVFPAASKAAGVVPGALKAFDAGKMLEFDEAKDEEDIGDLFGEPETTTAIGDPEQLKFVPLPRTLGIAQSEEAEVMTLSTSAKQAAPSRPPPPVLPRTRKVRRKAPPILSRDRPAPGLSLGEQLKARGPSLGEQLNLSPPASPTLGAARPTLGADMRNTLKLSRTGKGISVAPPVIDAAHSLTPPVMPNDNLAPFTAPTPITATAAASRPNMAVANQALIDAEIARLVALKQSLGGVPGASALGSSLGALATPSPIAATVATPAASGVASKWAVASTKVLDFAKTHGLSSADSGEAAKEAAKDAALPAPVPSSALAAENAHASSEPIAEIAAITKQIHAGQQTGARQLVVDLIKKRNALTAALSKDAGPGMINATIAKQYMNATAASAAEVASASSKRLYRVLSSLTVHPTVRAGIEYESAKVGELMPGSVIEVLEEGTSSTGVPRVRTAGGWASVSGKDGHTLLAPVDQVSSLSDILLEATKAPTTMKAAVRTLRLVRRVQELVAAAKVAEAAAAAAETAALQAKSAAAGGGEDDEEPQFEETADAETVAPVEEEEDGETEFFEEPGAVQPTASRVSRTWATRVAASKNELIQCMARQDMNWIHETPSASVERFWFAVGGRPVVGGAWSANRPRTIKHKPPKMKKGDRRVPKSPIAPLAAAAPASAAAATLVPLGLTITTPAPLTKQDLLVFALRAATAAADSTTAATAAEQLVAAERVGVLVMAVTIDTHGATRLAEAKRQMVDLLAKAQSPVVSPELLTSWWESVGGIPPPEMDLFKLELESLAPVAAAVPAVPVVPVVPVDYTYTGGDITALRAKIAEVEGQYQMANGGPAKLTIGNALIVLKSQVGPILQVAKQAKFATAAAAAAALKPVAIAAPVTTTPPPAKAAPVAPPVIVNDKMPVPPPPAKVAAVVPTTPAPPAAVVVPAKLAAGSDWLNLGGRLDPKVAEAITRTKAIQASDVVPNAFRGEAAPADVDVQSLGKQAPAAAVTVDEECTGDCLGAK